jgi:ubiquinone/menaquinone biosynthesis C-methylase UbiE
MKLQELQDAWDSLGKKDPLWAVLTSSDRWEPETFFQTGRNEISEVMDYINHLSIILNRQRALDFGCGVGRLSLGLAEYFDEVHGVDIAPSMIQAANQFKGLNCHGEKCQYHHNSKNDLLIFLDNYFDLIYSNIVLQHMAPKYTKNYLIEFLRILKPRGLLIFQLPGTMIVKNPLKRFLFHAIPESFWTAYRRIKWKVLDGFQQSPRMEMHGIERTQVIAFLSEKGGKVIDTRRDTRPTANQSAWEDYLYTVTKE